MLDSGGTEMNTIASVLKELVGDQQWWNTIKCYNRDMLCECSLTQSVQERGKLGCFSQNLKNMQRRGCFRQRDQHIQKYRGVGESKTCWELQIA